MGGAHFTRDLAIGLQTPIEDAERIKKESGTVLIEKIAGDETLEIPGLGTRSARSIPRKIACEILRDRAVELLELVKDQIWRGGQGHRLIAGAVITGGGSMLDGMVDLAERILEMPIRHGFPFGIRGLTDGLSHPVYATAVGLALFGAREIGDRKKHLDKANAEPWLFNRLLSWAGN